MKSPELTLIATEVTDRLWESGRPTLPPSRRGEVFIIIRAALDRAVATVQPTRPAESDMISPSAPGLEARVAVLEKRVDGIYNRLREAANMLF